MQQASLFYFDRVTIDLKLPLVDGRFDSIAVLC